MPIRFYFFCFPSAFWRWAEVRRLVMVTPLRLLFSRAGYAVYLFFLKRCILSSILPAMICLMFNGRGDPQIGRRPGGRTGSFITLALLAIFSVRCLAGGFPLPPFQSPLHQTRR